MWVHQVQLSKSTSCKVLCSAPSFYLGHALKHWSVVGVLVVTEEGSPPARAEQCPYAGVTAESRRGLVQHPCFSPLLASRVMAKNVCIVCINCFNFSPLGVKRSYSPPWSWVNEFIYMISCMRFNSGAWRCSVGGCANCMT